MEVRDHLQHYWIFVYRAQFLSDVSMNNIRAIFCHLYTTLNIVYVLYIYHIQYISVVYVNIALTQGGCSSLSSSQHIIFFGSRKKKHRYKVKFIFLRRTIKKTSNIAFDMRFMYWRKSTKEPPPAFKFQLNSWGYVARKLFNIVC